MTIVNFIRDKFNAEFFPDQDFETDFTVKGIKIIITRQFSNRGYWMFGTGVFCDIARNDVLSRNFVSEEYWDKIETIIHRCGLHRDQFNIVGISENSKNNKLFADIIKAVILCADYHESYRIKKTYGDIIYPKERHID